MTTAPPDALRQSLTIAHRVAAELKGRWRAEGDPDAAAALADHPSLARFKSLVIDLAYEEYCLREEAGSAPDLATFCDRFPAYRGSLRKVLEVHRLLADKPGKLAPPVIHWPSAGDTVEGLELIAELGRGTFGRAYLAFDPGTNRQCVLKLSVGRSAEARVVGPLDHPHVTGVYWARPVGDLSAVCMPLLGLTTLTDVRDAVFGRPASGPGRSADAILAAIHPDTPAAAGPAVVRPGESYELGVVAIAGRIAAALRYLHGEGVCHGDLKPSNVVLGSGGHPYLIDFNLAAGPAGPAVLVGGTLPYMAPEQRRVLAGRDPPGGFDGPRADLYSFGATVYELLTGELPYPGAADGPHDDAAGLTPPDPRILAPRTPAAVARLVCRCLSPDPAGRPADAGAVAREFDAVVAAVRGRRRRWRRRMAAVAAVGIGGLVLGGTLAYGPPATDPTGSVQTETATVGSPAPVPLNFPATAEECFDHGLQAARAKEYLHAFEYFRKAKDKGLNPSGRATAYMAYCKARMGGVQNEEDALGFARNAHDHGYQTVGVFNLLGYLLSKGKEPHLAIPPLAKAIEMDSEFIPAYYNRAMARYRANRDLPLAVADMELVLARETHTAVICRDAALLYTRASAVNPELRRKALQMVREAVLHGASASRLKSDRGLKALADDPQSQEEWDAITRLPQGPSEAPVDRRLIEP